MKRRQLVLASISSSLIATACGGNEDSAETRDSIQVLSVSPDAVRAGTNTEVMVTFRYVLTTTRQGVIDLGFFIDEVNQLLTGQSLFVPAGTGTGTLRATVDPRNFTTGSAFALGLLLSEEPHPTSWTPLARAKHPMVVGL